LNIVSEEDFENKIVSVRVLKNIGKVMEHVETFNGQVIGLLHKNLEDDNRIDAYIPSPTVQNHAANLLPLPNGDLLCVWFAGTQEGISDISVLCSRLRKGSSAWTNPVKLSDDPKRSEQNPVLFLTPENELWLLYTAQPAGRQNESIVRRRISNDLGETWGPIEVLFDTPGTFVRQPPVILDDGAWVIPLFRCKTSPGVVWTGDHDYASYRISEDAGRTWKEVVVPGSLGCVHMNIGRLKDGAWLALYRSRWADHIYRSVSTDGRAWSVPEPLKLPNNNSSIQFTILDNGHVALVFNNSSSLGMTERRASLYDDIPDDGQIPVAIPGEEETAIIPVNDGSKSAFWGAPRAPLTLAVSEDGGKSWPFMRDLEVGDGYCLTNNSKEELNREYSYPSIKQTPDGYIHIAFTYFRQKMKYTRVNEAWVREKS